MDLVLPAELEEPESEIFRFTTSTGIKYVVKAQFFGDEINLRSAQTLLYGDAEGRVVVHALKKVGNFRASTDDEFNFRLNKTKFLKFTRQGYLSPHLNISIVTDNLETPSTLFQFKYDFNASLNQHVFQDIMVNPFSEFPETFVITRNTTNNSDTEISVQTDYQIYTMLIPTRITREEMIPLEAGGDEWLNSIVHNKFIVGETPVSIGNNGEA